MRACARDFPREFYDSMAHQVLGNWVGEGNWEPTDTRPTEAKKPAPARTSGGEGRRPPVLRRPGASSKTAAPRRLPAPAPTPPKAKDKDSDVVIAGNPPKEEPPNGPNGACGPADFAAAVSRSKLSLMQLLIRNPTNWKAVTTIAAVSDAKEEAARSYHYSMRTEEETELARKSAGAGGERTARTRELLQRRRPTRRPHLQDRKTKAASSI